MSERTMDCTEARALVLDDLRARLAPDDRAALHEHLRTCSSCTAHVAAERALSEVLEPKLPRFSAPTALKERIGSAWPSSPVARPSAWRRALYPTLAAAAALAIAGGTARVVENRVEREQLAVEAVNDHLRVLEGAPLAQVTGGLHEVKPWFAGKLDFAPAVQFTGDADFQLEGGAMERFLDRRAALFVYKRRLHSISLFVVRSDGLAFPSGAPRVDNVRGFNVVLWKAGGQGFMLASDLDASEMLQLQDRIARSSGG